MEPAVLELTIVIPCYNEQEVLPETVHRIGAVLSGLVGRGKVAATSHICLVDDGSQDQTWVLIEQFAREQDVRPRHQAVAQPRPPERPSRGPDRRPLATRGPEHRCRPAGRCRCRSRRCSTRITPQAADIVFGVRKLPGRRHLPQALRPRGRYYRLLEIAGRRRGVRNHADYRLMSRRAIEALRGVRRR